MYCRGKESRGVGGLEGTHGQGQREGELRGRAGVGEEHFLGRRHITDKDPEVKVPGTREHPHVVGEEEVREGLGERQLEDSGGHVKMACWGDQATERQRTNQSKRVWDLSIS